MFMYIWQGIKAQYGELYLRKKSKTHALFLRFYQTIVLTLFFIEVI